MLARMKYIDRWGLMNNTKTENISEHSLQTAMFAHLLALIHNKNSEDKINAERAAVLGMYHDATEIITGDMPTPVKYYNPEIISSYKEVERIAGEKLVSMLPAELQDEYGDIILLKNKEDEELYKYVKAADKLSAYIKCIEERKAGNNEFISAEKQTRAILDASPLPEVKYFLDKFIPAFELTLDELGTIDEEGKA